MELTLKRGTEYTPILFQNTDLQNLKCCKLQESDYRRISLELVMHLPLSIEDINIVRVVADRLKSHWLYYFPGGIMTRDIVAIVVYKSTDPQDKYFIAQTEFFDKHTTYLTKLKRYINEIGIPSRTKLLLWPKVKIYSEFQELLSVEMKDYNPEIQKQLSNEFILAQRSNSNMNLGPQFKKGDSVVIINNDHGGRLPIGSIGIIENIRVDSLKKITWFRVDQPDILESWWYQGDGDIRLATEEEIDNYLGITAPEFEEPAVDLGEDLSTEHIDEILEREGSVEDTVYREPVVTTNREDLPI